MTFTNALQLIVDEAWVDVTTIDPDVYVGQVINITRGAPSAAGLPKPADVSLSIGDPNGTLNSENATSPLYGKIAQNTPVRVLCDGDVRATVELDTIVAQWDETDTDITARVAASGIRRRLENRRRPARSALYRSVMATQPRAFWALEDDSGAVEATSAVPGIASMSFVGEPQLGQAEAPAGAVSAASFPVAGNTTTARLVVPALPPSLSSTSWTVAFWRRISATSTGAIADGAEWYSSDSTLRTWVLGTLDAPDVIVVNIFSDAGALSPIAPEVTTVNVHDGEWHLFVIAAEQVGSNVEVTLTVDGTHTGSDSGAGTLGKLIGIPGVPRPSGTYLNVTTVGFSGLAIWDGLPDLSNLYDAGNGYLGETAGARLVRVFGEEGIPFALVGDAADTVAMGPQPVQTLIAIADDCATTDAGILYEPRAGVGGLPGMAYRTRTDLYNQTAALALDYGAGHLLPPFRPSADDARAVNDVTAAMPSGSVVRYVIPDGDALHRTTEDPPAGVGVYEDRLAANVSHAGLLHAAASWHAHVRAWKEQRFPEVTIDLSTDPFVDDPTLAADAAAVDLGDIITVDTSDAPRWTPPDGLLLTVPGIRETLTTFQRRITFVCTPGRPYSVGVLEGSGAPTEPPLRLETAGSQVTRDVSNSATTIRVGTVQGIAPWTTTAGYPADFPLDVDIGGEQVTVSAIAARAAGAYVGAGTPAHGNNASVVPGLPGGSPAAGDLLVLVAVVRNSGAGVPDEPDDWDTLLVEGNVGLFTTRYASGMAAPTVTFTGGVAGATTSAVIIALRDASAVLLTSATQLNSSAANIATPALAVSRDYCVELAIGWRQSSWTGSAAISGFTEAVDTSTTTGDDQALTVAYRIDTTAAAVAADTFTITGGSAAISRSIVVALRAGAQAFTVTRSVNGVLKAQTAGTAVRLWRPPVLAR